jgi:hypothetical protein
MLGQSAAGARASGRKERQFWAVDSESWTVRHVSGFEGRPEYPTIWWVPELGLSMYENRHLFDTQEEAIAAARAELGQRIADLQAKLEALV